MDWNQVLVELPLDRCFVVHEPFTPRYQRAEVKLNYLLRHGVVLGVRPPEDAGVDAKELAVWAPGLSRRQPDYYCCFRVFAQGGQPYLAVLFCFYDGLDEFPAFRSMDAAATYARSQGFSNDP